METKKKLLDKARNGNARRKLNPLLKNRNITVEKTENEIERCSKE